MVVEDGIADVSDRVNVSDRALGATLFLRMSLDFSPQPVSVAVSNIAATLCNI